MSRTAQLGQPAPGELEAELEKYRKELTGYCYRMLGSGFEADDAVQETMVRAWRSIDGFEGRSSLRSWLYRIATNVCLTMLKGRNRRARPVDLGPSSSALADLDPVRPESAWVQPIADDKVFATGTDPAEAAETRDTIRLAFIAALQHLPARQRAVLILREVLRWQAAEVAELLDTSVASVNSALQRARATLAERRIEPVAGATVDPEHEQLLRRYLEAFERYDVATLVSLVHEDVVFSMPPYPMWLQGPAEVSRWMLGPGIGCDGSRALLTRANGSPAMATYRPAERGVHRPFSIVLIEVHDGAIGTITNFVDADLFAPFGLPEALTG